MKKLFSILILCFVLIQPVHAATFTSQVFNKLYLRETKTINPIAITAENEGEITEKNGINILIVQDKEILWNKVAEASFFGEAVAQGYADATITPSYLNDYKVVHIPIKKDWPKGMSADLSGLGLRAYEHLVGSGYYFGYDLNGDLVADFWDINPYMVSEETTRTDVTPPYVPTDTKAVLNDTKTQILITWGNPPDYDFNGVSILKYLTRDGIEKPEQKIAFNNILQTMTDEDVQVGDIIRYELYSEDARLNASERVKLTISVEKKVETAPTPTPSTELDTLNRLYSSYKLRYSIKCFPSGVARPEGDAACLWAKIDLLYTQAKTGQSDVTAAFTAREKDLIALRLPFSQNRYQTQCIEAMEPASYCTALGKALDRAEYFLGN